MSAVPSKFPKPPHRTRLYAQVADQITAWITDNDLHQGDRLPPERELAARLGVSRATLSQALVALEVLGVVTVRHGDGTVLTDKAGSAKISDTIRAHPDHLPEVIDARDALETKLAALAAQRRTDQDLTRIRKTLDDMHRDIEAGGPGVNSDERFHAAVTTAAHSPLLAQMMDTISEPIRETRTESLSQPGRPRTSLAAHQRIADAITNGNAQTAAQAMHDHINPANDITLLPESP